MVPIKTHVWQKIKGFIQDTHSGRVELHISCYEVKAFRLIENGCRSCQPGDGPAVPIATFVYERITRFISTTHTGQVILKVHGHYVGPEDYQVIEIGREQDLVEGEVEA